MVQEAVLDIVEKALFYLTYTWHTIRSSQNLGVVFILRVEALLGRNWLLQRVFVHHLRLADDRELAWDCLDDALLARRWKRLHLVSFGDQTIPRIERSLGFPRRVLLRCCVIHQPHCLILAVLRLLLDFDLVFECSALHALRLINYEKVSVDITRWASLVCLLVQFAINWLLHVTEFIERALSADWGVVLGIIDGRGGLRIFIHSEKWRYFLRRDFIKRKKSRDLALDSFSFDLNILQARREQNVR